MSGRRGARRGSTSSLRLVHDWALLGEVCCGYVGCCLTYFELTLDCRQCLELISQHAKEISARYSSLRISASSLDEIKSSVRENCAY